MTGSLREYFAKERYVLLDTNLLVLLIVGQVRPNLLPRLSPGKYSFAIDDFEILKRIVAQFEQAVTTPYLLTEVSSILGKLDHNSMMECRAKLAEYLPALDCRYTGSDKLAQEAEFVRFGIADVSIFRASNETPFVTEDCPLIGLLQNRCSVLNYEAAKQMVA